MRSIAELAELVRQATKQVTVGSYYHHYRNPSKWYKVTGIGICERKEQPVVIYNDGMITWVRSMESWSEPVLTPDGQSIPRFMERPYSTYYSE